MADKYMQMDDLMQELYEKIRRKEPFYVEFFFQNLEQKGMWRKCFITGSNFTECEAGITVGMTYMGSITIPWLVLGLEKTKQELYPMLRLLSKEEEPLGEFGKTVIHIKADKKGRPEILDGTDIVRMPCPLGGRIYQVCRDADKRKYVLNEYMVTGFRVDDGRNVVMIRNDDGEESAFDPGFIETLWFTDKKRAKKKLKKENKKMEKKRKEKTA